MPGTITTDLTTVDAADVITNWLSLGTWGTAIAVNPDLFLQGTGCVLGRCTGPNQAFALGSETGQTGFDLSAGAHAFLWMKCVAWPAQDTHANGGLRIVMSSDATPTTSGTLPNIVPTNSKNWYVGGVDTDTTTGWYMYVVDPTSTADLTAGSIVLTSVKRLGLGTNTKLAVGGGAIKIPNLFVDVVRFGTGLTIINGTSGAPVTMADILATDSTVTNSWGVVTKTDGIYFISGKLRFGTTGQSAVTYFADTNQVLVYNFLTTAAGANLVANTFYEIILAGAASFGTTFQLGTFSGGLASAGCVIRAPGNSVWTFTANAANTTCNLYGSTFSQMRRALFTSTTTIRSCVFDTFGDTTPAGALIDSCTFSNVQTTANISGTYALIINATTDINSKITNCKFINCNKALKITAAGTYTFDNLTFSGNTFDIENTSGGLVTINAINGANPVTVLNTGGGSTTTINNSKTIKVTITDALTGAAIKNARVAIYKSGDLVSGHELLNALTDVNGVTTTTFNYSVDQAIVIRARAETPALLTPVNATFSTASTGGSLAAGTYWYRVTATNDLGETLASTETSQVVPAGTSTNTVTVNWGSVTDATGYKIYGRTSGAELFIASVGAVLTYTDTGSITPSGALPNANTTGTTRYFSVDATGTITVNGFTAAYQMVVDAISSSIPL